MVRQMSGVLDDLARSTKPEDRQLMRWVELFRNPQTGAIDREMLREAAKDSTESRQLKEVLARVYRGQAPRQRQELVDRAVDRIATL